MGFAGYFLVVWDLSTTRVSRGSPWAGPRLLAGSLTAYCLGITNIDPIRYGLLFRTIPESERISMPDMDIDFADDRRDEVIRYVAEKSGRDRVATSSNFRNARREGRDPRRGARARPALCRRGPDRQARSEFPLNITLDDAYQKSLRSPRR